MIQFVGNPKLLDCCATTADIWPVIEYCKTKKVIAVDTETTGLSHTSSNMIMLQIGDKDHQFVIDTRYVDIKPLRIILEDNSILKILHNVMFHKKLIVKLNIV